jgi:hypothetical protein
MLIKSYKAQSLGTRGENSKFGMILKRGPIIGMTQTTPAGAFLNQRNAYCEERKSQPTEPVTQECSGAGLPG